MRRLTFVDIHGRNVKDLGYLVHRREGHPAAHLLLGKVEKRDGGGLLVVEGILGDDTLHLLVVLRRKVERRVLVVVRRVPVLQQRHHDKEEVRGGATPGRVSEKNMTHKTGEPNNYKERNIFERCQF